MPNDFGHHGGPMGPIDGHDHCDHQDYTDLTNGANYARSPGLPDHIGYKPHINDRLKVDPNDAHRVDGIYHRIKLYYKRYEIKKSINLNCRIVYRNNRKLEKFNDRMDKYKTLGNITGSRVHRLSNKIDRATAEINRSERYLNDRLYHNYKIIQRYLTGYDIDFIEKSDDYYDAHTKEAKQREERRKLKESKKEGKRRERENKREQEEYYDQYEFDSYEETENSIPSLVSVARQSQNEIGQKRKYALEKIQHLLKILENMIDKVDVSKYHQILLGSDYVARNLSDNNPDIDIFLEKADAELNKMLDEVIENYGNVRQKS